MRLTTILRIAARNVRRNRRRTLITVLAMFLAVTIMVSMKGFNNSINLLVRDNFVDGHMGALQIHRKGYARAIVAAPLDLDVPADAQFLARLRGMPGVRAVAPRIAGGGAVVAHDRSVYAGFLAIDPAEEVKVCRRRFADLTAGAPISPASASGSDLTELLLTRLGARPGERAVVLTSDRDGVMNAVEIEIAGSIRDAGVFASEKKVAYLPLAVAQELVRLPGRATELAVAVDDLGRVEEVAAEVRAALGADFEVVTWRDLARFDEEASKARDQASGTFANILLLVALLGITNTMLMSVRERTREIGTMMAVGMRRRQILGLFLAEAALLGLCGGLLGIAAGGWLVHHFSEVGLKLPSDDGTSFNEFHPYVNSVYMAKLLVVAAVSAAVAALYPAYRASRLKPIEALSKAPT